MHVLRTVTLLPLVLEVWLVDLILRTHCANKQEVNYLHLYYMGEKQSATTHNIAFILHTICVRQAG